MPKVDLSSLPSVDSILQAPSANSMIKIAGRGLTVRAIRQSIDQIREEMIFERYLLYISHSYGLKFTIYFLFYQ